MREDDLFHVVIRLKILVRNLTAPLVTNEQSYLTEEPIQGRHSIENPEEQEHWVLTRRAKRPSTLCVKSGAQKKLTLPKLIPRLHAPSTTGPNNFKGRRARAPAVDRPRVIRRRRAARDDGVRAAPDTLSPQRHEGAIGKLAEDRPWYATSTR